jgi:hypothetical protein
MSDTRFAVFVADFGAYLFCLIGVAASRYIPDFKAGVEPEIVFSWFRLAMSALVALIVFGGFDLPGDKAGKRKAFLRRIVFALSQGFMWEQIIG